MPARPNALPTILRTVLGVVLIVLVLGVDYSGRSKLLLYGSHPTLELRRLPDPALRSQGRLTWLGGARLRGSDPAFGGFSALAVRQRGADDRLLMLGDGGNFTAFTIGRDWRPRAARFGALPGGPRTGWEKRDRDSESLTLDARGRAWVGFESANQLWRYAPGFVAAERRARPPAMRRWDRNGGAEAMARLPDGRFAVIAETSRWPGTRGRAAIVFAGDPTERPAVGFGFSYLPAPGFDPCDVAVLPNGDLLVLERRWLFPARFRSRLVIVPLAALRPGAAVTGREVGRIAPPWPSENFEGLAVTRDAGATILWLVSDDDQTWWRRSYLIKLRLDPETPAARRSGRATGRR